ncbi:MAG: glucose-1-phosphate adenylyltransferase [Myxococcota bacterium]|nr:glucose-1-phosphate adenylyltransferase [Myxococcota bacterium]
MKKTLAMVMAGGKGSRLVPLTCHRAKPAVPFGGRYRIIDFVLSNFINSGYRNVYVLSQYMASSLISHLNRNWNLTGITENIEVVPAQMRVGEHWYRGTADSIYQNLNLIRDFKPGHVAIFGGDHIYKFAIDQMDRIHQESNADLTVAAFPVPIEEAHQFGVIQVNTQNKIIGFQEKPQNPAPMPGNPTKALVSMGNYFFKSNVLEEALLQDAENPNSKHDFGHNIIPKLVQEGADVRIYDFSTNVIPGDPEHASPYWRDVGTIESYFQANMELRSALPALNMYNRQWRIRTAQRDYPPARFVKHAGDFTSVDIIDSLVCEGSIVSCDQMIQSLIGYDCFIHAGSLLKQSILFSGCDIGTKSQLNRVILDKNCTVASGTIIGEDREKDEERFPFITPSGIVVFPKGTHVPAEGPIEFSHDMAFLLENDKSTKDIMKQYKDRYIVADRNKHSHDSAGPRYRKFGPK